MTVVLVGANGGLRFPRRVSSCSVVLAIALSASVPPMTAPTTTASVADLCFGQTPTIIGTPGEEVVGTEGPDVIVTNGGTAHDVHRRSVHDLGICSPRVRGPFRRRRHPDR